VAMQNEAIETTHLRLHLQKGIRDVVFIAVIFGIFGSAHIFGVSQLFNALYKARIPRSGSVALFFLFDGIFILGSFFIAYYLLKYKQKLQCLFNIQTDINKRT